ncbi:hypothetical protein [Chromobacterium subtsugae]|uniref:hypothetical protein n=1 Tax=Chromobacterium subtsugae TaxID=251747 RepID=UPI0006413C6A|nr:hypothetical protein [Chromobacterium subtsugae]OBU84584.1 hypothetical protein MY55_21395 [Chromobacterium subtsugae]
MADNMMNGMNLLYPNLAQTQQQIELERQVGMQAMNQGMQPQPLQSVGGVAIRQSPLEGLARMLQTWTGAAMAKNAMSQQSELNQQYAQYLRGQFGADGAGAQPATQQQSDPGLSDAGNGSNPAYAAALQALAERGATAGPTRQATALAQALQQSSSGGGDGGGAGQTPAPPPATPPSAGGASMTLPGMTPQQAMAMYLMNPDKYTEAMLSQYKAPDVVTKLRAAGIDPSSQLGRQVLQDSIAKDNYIAPVPVRPGGGLVDPRTGHITTMPAAAPEGFQSVQTADGSWAMVPVQGGTAAVQSSAQAKAAGAAAVKPMTAYDADGNPVFTSELQASGGAPAGGGGRFAGYQAPGQAAGGNLRPAPIAGTNDSRVTIAQANAKRYNDLTTAATDSPTRVNVLDNIIQLSQNGVNTGPGSAWQNKILGYAANSPVLGSLVAGKKDSVTQFQEMQKFLAQNGLRQWQASGGTGTDSQLNAAMHANPNDEHFPQALQALATWNKAGEMALQAKAAAASQYMAQHGNDATQYNQFDNMWRQNFDPRIAQMQLMNPQDLQQFVGKLQPADKAQLLRKYQFVKQQGWM